MAGIDIKNLTVEHNIDNSILRVIDNLNLHIEENKITVILGKSGCGKTTLLRTIMSLENPKSGTVDKGTIRISYLFQEPRLMPWLNVYQNILFGNRDNSDKKMREDYINALIESAGLSGFKTLYPHQLSGGMQSRAALARALAYSSDFVLMDEPFAALDYFTRINMQQELIKLYTHKNFGILMVTHSIDEALVLGHKILLMGMGKIQKSYSVDSELNNRDLLNTKFIEIKKNIIEDMRRL